MGFSRSSSPRTFPLSLSIHRCVLVSENDELSIRFASGSFWSYELSKRALSSADDSPNQQALKVLFCGGLAGVVTWASIFPLGAQDPSPSPPILHLPHQSLVVLYVG